MKKLAPLAALVLGLVSLGTAHAADQTILGSTFQVKNPSTPDRRKVVIRASEKGSPNTLVGNPVTSGATLTVSANGTTPSGQVFSLPQGVSANDKPFWKGDAIRGFTYSDPDGEQGPVSKVVLKKSAKGVFAIQVQASGKTQPLNVTPPNVGTDACAYLQIDGGGDAYSVKFGLGDSTIVNKLTKEYSHRRVTAEGSCVPSCTDGVQNGSETDVDCGGPACGDCAAGDACLGAGDCATGVCTGNVCQAPSCGDGTLDAPGEECETGTGNDAACPGACDLQTCTCPLPSCGDGTLDAGEQCDDGVNNGNDRECTAGCRDNVCGDGKQNIAGPTGIEECDDGNAINTDFCTATCKVPTCGDGFTQRSNFEECDTTSSVTGTTCDATCGFVESNCTDGVDNDDDNATDGADSDCTPPPTCGDGNVDAGEQCDAGAANADDAACTTLCKTNVCGDGKQNIAGPTGIEECDDGNAVNTDFCTASCKVPTCGDGFIQRANLEECDAAAFPAGITGASCNVLCELVEADCDDGVDNDLDGDVDGADSECSAFAIVCGDGNLDAGEECDAGSANANNAACTASCKNNVCGDSFVRVGVEQCDDGNTLNTDFCTNTCAVGTCGDGFLQRWNGEECDVTSSVPGTACDAECGLTETDCNDALDNDRDGFADSQDPECFALAFVTSQTFDGNLVGAAASLGCVATGAAAGDCLCAASALNSSIPSVSDPGKQWEAYLADSSHTAHDGIPDRPYVLVIGTLVANGYSDLFDTLRTALQVDENGLFVPLPSAAWTGVDTPFSRCSDWTSTSDPSGGGIGDVGSATNATNQTATVFTCNGLSAPTRLFCFQTN